MDKDEEEILRETTSIKQYRQLISELRNSHIDIETLSGEKIEQIRSIIKSVCDLSIIRTHSFLSKLISETIISGEVEPILINDIVNNSPWKRDQVIKYLSILEKNAFLRFSVDANRNKTCLLNLGLENNSIEIRRMFEYYSNIFKKEQFTRKLISDILSYNSQIYNRKQELTSTIEQFRIQEVYYISDKQFSRFIDEILEGYNQLSTDDFIDPRKSIMKIIEKNPLFLKGITKEKKC